MTNAIIGRGLILSLMLSGALGLGCGGDELAPSALAPQDSGSGDTTEDGTSVPDVSLDGVSDADASPTDIQSDVGTPPDASSDIGPDAPMDVSETDAVDVTEDVPTVTDIADAQTDAQTDAASADGDAGPPSDAVDDDAAAEDVVMPEDLPLPGDLLITELMANPDGISDADGEWFEVVSLAAEAIDLAHCTIHDGGIDSFPLALFAESLVMEPGARWVLGPNPDTETNGGVEIDVVYTDFYLSNQSDEVRVSCAGVLVDEVAYDAAWPIEAGASLSFDTASDQDSASNDSPVHWCLGQTEYTAGNTGTPGEPNEACPVPDTEVDSCRLTAPDGLAVVQGQPLLIAALVYDEGDTDQTTSVDEVPLLVAQAGWGPEGSEPDSWAWTDATGDLDWDDAEAPGFDRYFVSVTAPELGDYSALFRFSMDDGATWTLCDLTGSEDGLSLLDAGAFTTAEDPCVDIGCGAPPEPTCLDGVYTTYSGEGTCVPNGVEPVCAFDEVSEDCTLTGGTCGDGGCEGGATVPTAGQLVINEIMSNPSAVTDGKGEWFSLVNISEGPLNLEGCTIAGDNDSGDTVNTGGPMVIQPGEEAVFVRNGDLATNGGVPGHYTYSGIALGNSSDALSFHCGDEEIDAVAWDDGATFPDEAGASMQLDAGSLDAALNDSGENWCAAETPFGSLGDFGTPGTANQLCSPCLDVVCDAPPEPFCDGSVAMAYASDGVCEIGECIYSALEPIDCSLADETCVAGACMTPCAYFCELSESICQGGLAVDFGEDSCLETCAQWAVGLPGDEATDTTWCRVELLAQGDEVVPSTACAAAAPDGGEICVDPPTICEQYCELAPTACQNDQEIVFEDDDCLAACESWDEGDSDDMLSDTTWCRWNHLNMAEEDPALHCSAATPDGGEVCIDHCADVVCDPAPDSFCDGSVGTSYPESTCDEGVCVSEPVVQDCSITDQLCEGGLCVTPPTLCEEYCALVTATCLEENVVDFGEAGCLAACEAWPAGDDDDAANGTTWCRINKLQDEALSPAEACASAGVDGGGVCVTTVVNLVINEVDYDQASVDSSEFVEIYNPTDQPAFLNDYEVITLNGAVGEPNATFLLSEAGAELPANGYLVIGVPALLTTLPEGTLTIAAEVDFLENAGNGGDAVGVFHKDGITVDTLSYGGAVAEWTEGETGAGVDTGEGALARCPNGVDTNSNEEDFSWVESVSPAAPNDCPAETP